MKRASLFALLAFCLFWMTSWLIVANVTSAVNKTTVVDSFNGRNILPEIIALNNGQSKPSTKFRTGHVTNTELNNYLEKTKDGYCIKLP
jgi:hypothetical protein